MREKYESLSLATLKDLAKARGLKGISTMRKPELIERMLEEDKKEQEYLNNRTKNLTPVKSYQDMSDEELEYILNNIKGSTKEQEEKIRNAARVSEILRNTDYLSDIIKKQKQ